MNTRIRYTLDGKNYTETETTIEDAQRLAILTNALGGMFWWWSDTASVWQLSNI